MNLPSIVSRKVYSKRMKEQKVQLNHISHFSLIQHLIKLMKRVKIFLKLEITFLTVLIGLRLLRPLKT